MKPSADQIFEAFVKGVALVGYHVSHEEGEKLKADPRYESLTEERKKFLEVLIDPS